MTVEDIISLSFKQRHNDEVISKTVRKRKEGSKEKEPTGFILVLLKLTKIKQKNCSVLKN